MELKEFQGIDSLRTADGKPRSGFLQNYKVVSWISDFYLLQLEEGGECLSVCLSQLKGFQNFEK
jgi:hypothetical protein